MDKFTCKINEHFRDIDIYLEGEGEGEGVSMKLN